MRCASGARIFHNPLRKNLHLFLLAMIYLHPPFGMVRKWMHGPMRGFSYYTQGKGNFAVTGMEDTGTLQSLKFLAQAGRVDWNRVLVLRTVSNYDQQPENMTAAQSLAGEKAGRYSAFLPALESAYAVGHVVVDTLVQNWPRVQNQVPHL